MDINNDIIPVKRGQLLNINGQLGHMLSALTRVCEITRTNPSTPFVIEMTKELKLLIQAHKSAAATIHEIIEMNK